MKKVILLTFLIGLMVSGWAWGAAPESYLPLKEGMFWEYRNKFFDLKSHEQLGSGKAIKKNLAPMELQGTKVVPEVFSFYEPADTLKMETSSFIVQDANGFSVFARQGPKERTPSLVPGGYYILKFPLTKGASWKQEAEGFIRQDTIEATDASVQVPAGSFTNCLLIKRLYFSPKNPGTPLQEALFWFAPDVGPVKVDVKNLQENKEMVQELVSFKK